MRRSLWTTLVLALSVAAYGLGPVQPAQAASGDCTHFVDTEAASDGNGSAVSPWKGLIGRVDGVPPGSVICVRGDTAGSGRMANLGSVVLKTAGTANAPITLQPYPGEKVIWYSSTANQLIKFDGAAYWIVDGFTLENGNRGWRAVQFEDGAHHNILRNNEIRNGHVDGVAVVRGSPDNVIANNLIHHFANPDTSQDAHCIVVQPDADRTQILSNTIHDCSGDGIQLINADPITIAEYPDGVQIIGNVIYRGTLSRAENALDIKAARNLQVLRNTLSGYFDDAAVVVHYGSQSVLFDSNRVFDSARGFSIQPKLDKKISNLTLRNNLIYNLSDYAIQIAGVESGVVIHNTIFAAQQQSIAFVGKGLVGGVIANNLVVASGQAYVSSQAPFSQVAIGTNGWFNTSVVSRLSAASDLVSSGSPGFLNAAAGDFRLSPGSPARNFGADYGVRTDFEGEPRPVGCRPDLGADETRKLCLTAVPHDASIRLTWNHPGDGSLASYSLTYTSNGQGADAQEGASPLNAIPANVQSLTLTGLTNYVFYTFSLTARDGSHATLYVSPSVAAMPTDRFVFIPLVQRNP